MKRFAVHGLFFLMNPDIVVIDFSDSLSQSPTAFRNSLAQHPLRPAPFTTTSTGNEFSIAIGLFCLVILAFHASLDSCQLILSNNFTLPKCNQEFQGLRHCKPEK